jgi:hypothetical protein
MFFFYCNHNNHGFHRENICVDCVACISCQVAESTNREIGQKVLTVILQSLHPNAGTACTDTIRLGLLFVRLFTLKHIVLSTTPIDISQYRLLFGFFLLYTDRVPFELLDSAALL